MLQAVLRHCGQEEIGPSDVVDQSKDAMRHAVLPPPDRNGYSELTEFILLLLPDRRGATSGLD
jgi:hypothetical protein